MYIGLRLLSDRLVDLDLLPAVLEAACSDQQLVTIKLLLKEVTGTTFEKRALYNAKIAAYKGYNDRVLQFVLGIDMAGFWNRLEQRE